MLRQQNRLPRCSHRLIVHHLHTQCRLHNLHFQLMSCCRAASSLVAVDLSKLQPTTSALLPVLDAQHTQLASLNASVNCDSIKTSSVSTAFTPTPALTRSTVFGGRFPNLDIYDWKKSELASSTNVVKASAAAACGAHNDITRPSARQLLLPHHCHLSQQSSSHLPFLPASPAAPTKHTANVVRTSAHLHHAAQQYARYNAAVFHLCPVTTGGVYRPATAIGRSRRMSNADASCSSNRHNSTSGGGRHDRPTHAHLNHICLRLIDYVPEFFKRNSPDLTIYREDLEFDDRIFHYRSVGLRAYWYHLGTLMNLCRVTAAAVEMQVVSVWPAIDDGTVRLRWRVVHLPVYQMHKLWSVPRGDPEALSKALNKHGRWHDGYSVFHVDGEGMVYRHVMDRVMPDGSRLKGESSTQRLARRLLGVAPAPK